MNTKLEKAKLSDVISEETIYRAFIKYCKFNSGLSLSSKMQTICGINKANFDTYDPITKKISILKNENGTMWGKKDLDNLMILVHNHIELDINTIVKTKKSNFEDMVNFLKLKTEKNVFSDEVMEQIIEVIDRFGVEYDTKKDDIVNDLILSFKNESFKINKKISDFLKLYLSPRHVTAINKFLNTMEQYNDMENIDFMSLKDSMGFFSAEQLKTMIIDMCIVYPEIIINKVEYSKKPIPSHWGLTAKHIKDMENIIFTEMSDLQKTYNNKELNAVLKMVQNKTTNIYNIINIIPFYADLMIDENKKTIFNSELLTCIYKYLFLKTLDIYIIELNKITFIPKDMEFDIGMGEAKGSIDEELLKGRKMGLGKSLANLIRYYVRIFKQRKKF